MFFNYKTKPNTFNQSSVIYSVIAVTITLEKLEETLTLRRMSILTSGRNQNQQNIHPILNNQLELPFLSLFCHGITEPICDVLRNLIHLYKFKKREKHPRRSKASFLHGFFFTFFIQYKW